MRTHDSDQGYESELRPKSSRVDDRSSDIAVQAAMAGQFDAAGPSGILGLQRAVGNSRVTEVVEEERSPVHDVISSSGSPLPTEVRADMEGRFGTSFGDVRVHNDGAAHESASSVNAQAYTVGPNIVFQRDKYDPSSDAGNHMLAHELTHVVQQRNGPVDGSDAGGGVKVSDPSDRFEREAVANADRVMAGPANSTDVHGGTGVGATSATSVQRQEEEAAPEEEEVSAQTFVQRAEEEEAQEEEA
jgi:hypothetical protein